MQSRHSFFRLPYSENIACSQKSPGKPNTVCPVLEHPQSDARNGNFFQNISGAFQNSFLHLRLTPDITILLQVVELFCGLPPCGVEGVAMHRAKPHHLHKWIYQGSCGIVIRLWCGECRRTLVAILRRGQVAKEFDNLQSSGYLWGNDDIHSGSSLWGRTVRVWALCCPQALLIFSIF